MVTSIHVRWMHVRFQPATSTTITTYYTCYLDDPYLYVFSIDVCLQWELLHSPLILGTESTKVSPVNSSILFKSMEPEWRVGMELWSASVEPGWRIGMELWSASAYGSPL